MTKLMDKASRWVKFSAEGEGVLLQNSVGEFEVISVADAGRRVQTLLAAGWQQMAW